MDKLLFVIRAASPLINLAYKALLLGVLIWIGYGLQDVATAIHASTESCLIDPAAIDGENGDAGGLVKPLFRG